MFCSVHVCNMCVRIPNHSMICLRAGIRSALIPWRPNGKNELAFAFVLCFVPIHQSANQLYHLLMLWLTGGRVGKLNVGQDRWQVLQLAVYEVRVLTPVYHDINAFRVRLIGVNMFVILLVVCCEREAEQEVGPSTTHSFLMTRV